METGLEGAARPLKEKRFAADTWGMRLIVVLLAALSLAVNPLSASDGRSQPRSERRDNRTSGRRVAKCESCDRAANGRIKRSTAMIREFRREKPCPATGKIIGACPGYQIDHRIPLAKGGADEPTNMEWLTIEEHKAKTAKER